MHLISAFRVALRSPSVFGLRVSVTSVSSYTWSRWRHEKDGIRAQSVSKGFVLDYFLRSYFQGRVVSDYCCNWLARDLPYVIYHKMLSLIDTLTAAGLRSHVSHELLLTSAVVHQLSEVADLYQQPLDIEHYLQTAKT